MSARLAKDVLSYWLSLLRHEEALVSSPKARRPLPADQLLAPQLSSPTPGQDYVKLPYAGNESLLVDKMGTVARPLEGEVVAFFEHWLHGQYRGSSDERMQHLVCYPTLLLPRQELGGLLRFDVDVTWKDAAGKSFVLPSASERRRGAVSPVSLEVSATVVRGDGSAAFFVDHRLLRQVLCLDDERVEALGKAVEADLSPQHTVRELCRALHGQLQDDAASNGAPQADDLPEKECSSAELLASLSRLTQLRLAQLRSRARAFDTALLVNTGRNRATFHVQRDIQALLDADEIPDGPLSMYLSATRHAGGRAALLGRWPTAGVTASQRAAAEVFLGSTLTAVQGPPGTGKTHMILNLAAHQLVENMAKLAQKQAVPEAFLLVTSTNNRAVDNVIEALNGEREPADQRHPSLALSLRVGSRDVIEGVTVRQLEAALRHVERGGSATDQELETERRSFLTQFAKVQQLIEPHTRALGQVEARARQESELARLEQRTPPAPFDQLRRAIESLGLNIDPQAISLNELGSALGKLERRLIELSSMAEVGKRAALVRLEQHFRHTRTTALGAVNEALGTTLALPLPPEPSGGSLQAQREAWEEAAETAIERVNTLRNAVASTLRDDKDRLRAEELRRQLAVPCPAAAGDIDWSLVDTEQERLFDAALTLRSCWIRHHQRALSTALKKAIETCRSARSLRGARDADATFGLWLRQLFPVWGCTLLSLGNNFDAEPGRLGRVVVDEAGQCHPAHVTSALLRARSALLVGDTHQLEPVIDLTRAQEKRVLQTLKLRSRGEQFERFRVYEGGNTSAQSLADAVVDERPTLIDHFRCQTEIVAISDQLCSYGLQVHTPPRSCVQLVPLLSHSVLFSRAAGEQERFAGSWCNHAEVELVVAWLRALTQGGISSDDIGIVTPFRGQNEVLWRRLRELGFRIAANSAEVDTQQSLFERSSTGIALGTVHRFQGGERRIMLFSTTATRVTTLPFLDARVNLVNVAASRAKEHLITIGDEALLQGGQHTRLLLAGARRVSPLG